MKSFANVARPIFFSVLLALTFQVFIAKALTSLHFVVVALPTCSEYSPLTLPCNISHAAFSFVINLAMTVLVWNVLTLGVVTIIPAIAIFAALNRFHRNNTADTFPSEREITGSH